MKKYLAQSQSVFHTQNYKNDFAWCLINHDNTTIISISLRACDAGASCWVLQVEATGDLEQEAEGTFNLCSNQRATCDQ